MCYKTLLQCKSCDKKQIISKDVIFDKFITFIDKLKNVCYNRNNFIPLKFRLGGERYEKQKNN